MPVVVAAGLLIAVPCSIDAQGVPRLSRVAEIGCPDCGGAPQFATIRDVVVTDSGAVLVVSSEAPTLRMFDRGGRALWTAGREGAGPGEYRLPIRAVLGRAGVQVVDMTLRRVTRLKLDGSFVSSAPLGSFSAAVAARGRTGEMVILTDDFRGGRVLQRWTMSDSGSRIADVPPAASPTPGVLMMPSAAVAPSGEIALLRDGNEYQIFRLSASGAQLGTISRDIPRVRRTAAELAALERRRQAAALRAAERLRASGRGAPPAGGRPTLQRAGDDELKPHMAIDGLRFDDGGRLWIRTMRGGEGTTIFDLFAPDGAFIGEVTVPAMLGAFSLAGRWMAADTESADGTPRVTLWEVRQ